MAGVGELKIIVWIAGEMLGLRHAPGSFFAIMEGWIVG